MPTIEINSNHYDVYADVAEADVYLAGAIHAGNCVAASEATKQQALISATRLLDRQRWLGDKTADSGQSLEWPRTGTGIDGVEDDIVPEAIVNGTIELALSLVDGSDVQADATPGAQKLESIKAGSVALTYFRSAESALAQSGRFPTVVQELVGPYLAGSTLAVTGLATGTCGESVTADKMGFSGGL